MSALVPYASRVVIPAAPTMARYAKRYAGAVVKWNAPKRRRIGAMYRTAQYLARAERGATKIARWYRRRRAFKSAVRRNVGERVGSSNSKGVRTQSIGAPTNMVERQLYSELIVMPQRNITSGEARNERERDVINIRGIKICQDFETIATGAGDNHMYLNVALISNKHNPQSASINNNRFFRGRDDARGQDFDSLSSGIDYHCRPINTDEWNIFFHTRRVLSNPRLNITDGKTFARVMKYVKINRQIRFDQDGEPSTRFFLVYWCALACSEGPDNPAIFMKSTFTHQLYFRETKA